MNKTAREMFEELGYKEREESYKNNEIISIRYANYRDGNWITIYKNHIECIRNRANGFLPLNILPAINKQVEELGWNK